VDDLLSDAPGLATSARIVPSIKDGQPNGFKLYAIRPSSYFAKLGFQNGDTITQFNGMDISSPEKALEAYSKLRSVSKITIEIIRRGQPVSLEYTIK
jgi:general secretion pathway protein C